MGVCRPLCQPEGLLWGQASRCPGGWVLVELAGAWQSWPGMPAAVPLLPASQAASFVHTCLLGRGLWGPLSTRPWGASAPAAPDKPSPARLSQGPCKV